MKLNKVFSLIVLCSFASQDAFANLQSYQLNPESDFVAPRWVYDAKSTSTKSAKVSDLIRAREFQMKGQNAACAQELRKAYPRYKQIQPWIITFELECAIEEAKSKGNAAPLVPSLVNVEKDLSRLFIGAQAQRAKVAWVSARLRLMESDIKGNRPRAWESAGKLQKLGTQLDKKDRAQLYRLMGELAFVQQRWDAAKEYFTRSMKDNENEEVRSRLKAVESILPKKAKEVEAAKPEQVTNPALEVTADEIELVQKVTVALGSGELLSAVEVAIKLIRQFPGGVRAKWAADRVLEAYLSLVDKSDPKFVPVRENIVAEMAKADSDRLTEWARVIYNRAQYADSLKLSERAIANAERGVPNARMYELAADSALNLEKYVEAKKYYQVLISDYGGTTSAREALLRSALIDYRKAQYISTITQLERLLVLPQADNYEVVARYWLWRSQQKLKSDQAQGTADILIQKYPFSYYGLRAQLERNNGILEKISGKEKLETTLWLTDTEKENFDRVRLLLSAGWLDEAQAELKLWPDPIRPRDKAVLSLVYAAAYGYGSAVRLANEAWDEDPTLRKDPLFTVAFPTEFKTDIQTQATARKVDPKLVAALIKQESAYQVKAVSSSSAYGLMQMIAPTARDVAGELKIKDLDIPQDMFVPATNIKMGTYYLAQMVQKYNGFVPLALAAYNAGPARIDRFIRSRPSLEKLSQSRSGDPDEELWVDELPWSETSFYVKAILRNYLLYQLFENNRISVAFPVWNEGAVKVTPRTPSSVRKSSKFKN